ncbi:MAG TPA: DUF2330 domain-containing protein [Polyangiaceae bacterium]|nr:DUF2330 domain-containing protein [Polyangiaceae bacterium]
MRPHTPHLLAGLGFLCASWLSSGAVEAQTAVFPAPQDSTEVRELRVAFSSFGESSSTWVQLGLYGGADEVFVVLPVAPEGRVDLASDAWFEALRAATHPRVLPPEGSPPSCSAKPAPAKGTVDVVGSDQHLDTLAPDPAVALHSLAQLLVWADGRGLTLSAEQTAWLAQLEVSGQRFALIRFEPVPGATLTRTVRVSPSLGGAVVPLLLTRAGAARVAVNAWVFSEGKAVPASLPALTVVPSSLRWNVDADPPSSYARDSEELLEAKGGKAWVIDAASHTSLFFHTSLPGGTGLVPSVAGAYLERASGYGDAPDAFAACLTRFATLESSALRVAPACGRGDLASAGGAPCSEVVSGNETNPADLRCGATADDLAIALSGAVPAKAWVTRWSGWIAAWESRPAETVQSASGSAPLGPLFTAAAWHADCAGDAGAEGGAPDAGASGAGGSGGSSSGGGTGYGGYAGWGGSENHGDPGGGWGNSTGQPGAGGYYEDEYGEDYGSYDNGSGVYVEVNADTSCASSSSSSGSGDSCSGDSSSSSSGDSCSGDSSGDEPSSCSGDSSSSSGDSCSGDSSSGGGESCSGDSSSSSGGDSCSGSSSSGGPESCSGGGTSSPDCSVVRGKGGRRRPPLSGITLALAGVLLPLRRFTRSRARKSDAFSSEA